MCKSMKSCDIHCTCTHAYVLRLHQDNWTRPSRCSPRCHPPTHSPTRPHIPPRRTPLPHIVPTEKCRCNMSKLTFPRNNTSPVTLANQNHPVSPASIDCKVKDHQTPPMQRSVKKTRSLLTTLKSANFAGAKITFLVAQI